MSLSRFFLPGGLEISIAKNGWMIQWYQSNVKFANGAFISVLWLENRRAASAAFLNNHIKNVNGYILIDNQLYRSPSNPRNLINFIIFGGTNESAIWKSP